MRTLESVEKELHQAAAVRNFTPKDDPEFMYWQHEVERLHHIYQEMLIEKREQERIQRELGNDIRMGKEPGKDVYHEH